MRPTQNPGRIAGLWYLLLIAIGPLFLIYIPNKLFVHGNTTATVHNIAAHERLFRVGILAELVGGVVLIFLVLAFYRLFQGVDRYLAVLVVILGGVLPAVIYFVNVVNEFGVLMVAGGADFLSVFDKPQRDALAMVFLRLHGYQIDASLVLAGAWLFPLATLVYRSRFLPRFLGVWLAIAGFGWLTLSFTAILAPQYQDKLFSVFQPAFFGEIALTLWLVIKGARPPALDGATSFPVGD
ncbi:MAG TPA: DUF4386 domain-containing protein [Candidatus Nitrosotalea sp.]|nr:DUF4386 domain-containing protein [Candidatus Nitrosotalea sp.]